MDENYIVRIYRRALPVEPGTETADKPGAESLVGVVEEAASGQRYPFHNMQELMTILNTPPHRLD